MSGEAQVGSSRQHYVLLPVVLILTFAAYSGTLRYEFVYDDLDVIVNNNRLTSWSYLPGYFTEHLWIHQSINLPVVNQVTWPEVSDVQDR